MSVWRHSDSSHPIRSAGTVTYVYDAAGTLAAEYTPNVPTAQSCSSCYLTPDALASTRLVTNDGSYVSRHDFAAFGEELNTSDRQSSMGYGLSDSMTHLYIGEERDAETGLDFVGARYFSSAQVDLTGLVGDASAGSIR